MRPAEFASEQVIQAGQELQAAGRNITGFALRQKVGGGNPTRLKQIWDEHINSTRAATAEPVAELPVEVAEEVATVTRELTDRLSLLAVGLNDKAVKSAERRVSEVVRAAGEQREQAERELADATETVDDLESKLEEAKAGSEQLESQLADSRNVNQAQAVELAQVRERLALMEQNAKALADQHAAELARVETERSRRQQEAEQLRGDLATAKGKAEAAEQAHQEHREQAAVYANRLAERIASIEVERDGLRKEVEQLRGDLATIKAKADAAEQAHQEHRKQAATEAHRLAERAAATEKELDSARKEASKAREDAAKLLGQLEALQTQAAEQLRALVARDKVAGEVDATGTKTGRGKKSE